jgi:hypothetical protein
MWYSRRGWKTYREDRDETYRLGYAVSCDGQNWVRRDGDIGFSNPPEPGDWDFIMQAYPAVIQLGDQVLCFYSGNGFGQSGIGYSTLEGAIGAPWRLGSSAQLSLAKTIITCAIAESGRSIEQGSPISRGARRLVTGKASIGHFA